MTGKQEGPYKGEETKAEEDKLWQLYTNTQSSVFLIIYAPDLLILWKLLLAKSWNYTSASLDDGSASL